MVIPFTLLFGFLGILYYNSKDEKKYGPLINLANFENKLIVADNFGKTYAMNIDSG